jgi:hypothetical protein
MQISKCPCCSTGMLLKPPSYLERGCVFKCQLAAVATIARGLDAYGDEDPAIIYGRVQRKAVSLLTSSIRPPTQVARELGAQPPLLHHWRDDRQANGTVTGSVGSLSSGDVSAEHAESRRMEKEPARAQIERGGLAMDERINQELTLNMRQASA